MVSGSDLLSSEEPHCDKHTFVADSASWLILEHSPAFGGGIEMNVNQMHFIYLFLFKNVMKP